MKFENSVLRRSVPLLILAAAVLVIPAAASGTNGYTSVGMPDGTLYNYETYGIDHSTYEATIFSAESDAEVLYISTVLEGHNVTKISANAFSGCKNARAVVVPERIELIGADAFSGCAGLESVYFLGDAPVIADGAFPSGVGFYRTEGSSGWGEHSSQAIKQYTSGSGDGSSVTYYIIEDEGMAVKGSPSPDGSVTILPYADGYPVTSIGPYSFSGKDNASGTDIVPRSDITSVSIPEGVEIVRERAFYYNAGLESISLPQSLTIIMDEAFRAASSMGAVDMPDDLRYIGFESFRQCSSMDGISIPDSTYFVGEGAFKICTGAKSITIGKGVSEIMPWTFAYCSSASVLDVNGDVSDIGASSFYMCGSLVSVSLPDTVISIGSGTFFECTSLERISLGDSLVSIGADAFSECSALNNVRVPDTVSEVSSRAFAYCSGMTDIYFAGDMPEFGTSVFLNSDVMVHCKESNRGSWSGFSGNLIVDSSKSYMDILLLGSVLAALVVAAAVWVKRSTR